MRDPLPLLMGAETEYGFALIGPTSAGPTDPARSVGLVMPAVARHFRHLPSTDGQGVFLGNAGKFYIDQGAHPEYATPECDSPTDLVRYTLAGDRIMAKVAAEVDGSTGQRVFVFRGNVGYEGPTTWACHESYLTVNSCGHFRHRLLPFLASRIVYGGVGGFNPFSQGIQFSLSPRSHFISTDYSGSTTDSNRGLLNTRDETLSEGGYNRLHLIAADSLGSQTGLWLRTGATALVIRMIDEGIEIPATVEPRNAVSALHMFALDPTLKVRVATSNGGAATALEIQRAYLEAAKTYAISPRGRKLPAWGSQVLQVWEGVLDLLEDDAAELNGVLDWRIKRELYGTHIQERGFTWQEVES